MARAKWIVLLLALMLTFSNGHAVASVTVSEFNAQGQADRILLSWTTASEINNAGFNLLRSNTQNGTYNKINTNLIPSKGAGVTGSSYDYADRSVTINQAYFYKLESVDTSGRTELFGPVTATAGSSTTPTPQPSPTPVATATATTKPTATATSVPSLTPTATSLPSSTPTVTPHDTLAPSATPTVQPSATATPSPSATATTVMLSTSTATPVVPTNTPLPQSTATPTRAAQPTNVPIAQPSMTPIPTEIALIAIPQSTLTPTPASTEASLMVTATQDTRANLQPTRASPSTGPSQPAPQGADLPLLIVGVIGLTGLAGLVLTVLGGVALIWIARAYRRR